MTMTTITLQSISRFAASMQENERASATISKYTFDLKQMMEFFDGQKITKIRLLEYRNHLKDLYQIQTVNSKISAINSYLDFCGLSNHKMKLFRIQKKIFMEEKRELTKKDYMKLLAEAKIRNKRLYYIMKVIGGTGMRVSELSYITVKAVMEGKAEVYLKGKQRVIILQKELQNQLKEYIREHGIESGAIFSTKGGKPVDRSNICHDMKKISSAANVEGSKVFPHNLRHLFARSFYEVEKNIAHLADVLGHSSINTTRIYIMRSVREYERAMRRIQLNL